MRRFRTLVLLVAVVAAVVAYFVAFHPRQRLPDHPYFHAPGPWVVAHRGGAALAPENTLAAFERAKALGVDVLEMDLRVTADNALAVIHDATVDRTTNGTGRVGDTTLSNIQGLDAGYRFVDETGGYPFRGSGITVPSLPEVLRRFPVFRLNVEMKEFTADEARALCVVLREHDATGRVLLSSFPHPPMAAFREACPEVATGATRREVIIFDLLHRVRLGRLFRSPAATLQVPLRWRGREVLTASMVERAHEFNLPVQAWTVNDDAEMKRSLEMGVQAVLTDHPDVLLALLGRGPGPPSS